MTVKEFGRRSFVIWTAEDLRKEREAEKEIKMSREIKFRAWDKENREMKIVTQLEFDVKGIAILGSFGWYGVKEHLGNYILMQFTGLKDKNGKEYYFDDIAKWNNKLWVVVWSITLAGIELQPLANYRERQENPEIKRLYGSCFGIGQAHFSERIGNIHTTPEEQE